MIRYLLLALLVVLPAASPALDVIFPRESTASTTQTLTRKIRSGEAFAFVVRPDGELLDPARTQLRWAGRPIPQHLYYKAPHSAILFGLVPEEFLRADPAGELAATATPLDGEPVTVTAALDFRPLPTTNTIVRPLPRRGSRVRIVGESGDPIAGALLFGQTRRDMLAITSEGGTVVLDAPQRGSATDHLVRAPGYWTAVFQPLRERRVVLRSREEVGRTITVRPGDLPFGEEAPERALLLIANDHYVVWRGEPIEVRIPGDRAEAIVIVPGRSPQRFELGAD